MYSGWLLWVPEACLRGCIAFWLLSRGRSGVYYCTLRACLAQYSTCPVNQPVVHCAVFRLVFNALAEFIQRSVAATGCSEAPCQNFRRTNRVIAVVLLAGYSCRS
jgi:hypothetical protein